MKNNKTLPQLLVVAVFLALVFLTPLSKRRELLVSVERLNRPQQVAKTLVLSFGDRVKQLVDTGVIDKEKFLALYASRGGVSPEVTGLLDGTRSDVRLSEKNAGELLNILWAIGLGNDSVVLKQGTMQDPRYGGAGGFASTGGWTLARGEAMAHYAMHHFVALTPVQELLVKKVADLVYRPCCDNPTSFPDCNHGMAMLGALELFAAQGASEEELFEDAHALNRAWFSDKYEHLATYAAQKGVILSARDMVSEAYMSGSGHARVMKEMKTSADGGASCSA